MTGTTPSLRTVAGGLVVRLVSLGLAVLTVIVFFGSAIVAGILADPVRRQSPLLRDQVLIAIGVMAYATLVLDLLASVLCLSTPRPWDAIRYLYGSLTVFVVGFFCLTYTVFALFLPLPQVPEAIGLLVVPSALTASVLFMIFLGRLAGHIDRRDLARSASSVLFWSVLSGVSLAAALIAFALTVGGQYASLAIVPAVVAFALSAATAGRYVTLLIRLSRAVFSVADTSNGLS